MDVEVVARSEAEPVRMIKVYESRQLDLALAKRHPRGIRSLVVWSMVRSAQVLPTAVADRS
jgi:hypothetical protein